MRFTIDNNKAMQTIIWILNKKPNISKYNIMKVMFSADCYHLNNYGRLIYGESYLAMNFGTVPSKMKDLLEIKNNVPYFQENNRYKANTTPDLDLFSETDIEALEFGIKEYADLSFDEVLKKNHQHRAWKKYAEKLKKVKRVQIDYEEMIDNQEVLVYLKELGNLTENIGY